MDGWLVWWITLLIALLVYHMPVDVLEARWGFSLA
jgi:L-lactate permease